jgi:uncharacterized membrane protein (UPF0127 family)
MPTNEARRELLNRVRASGYPGSITEVFQASDQGIDLIEQHQMQQQQQQMQVAQTPQEQEVGLRGEHAAGNTQASMAFPDVQPNQSFNTVGMEAPIDIQKVDDQGHLVESYENVPPGIQDLPTGPYEGTIIESPAAYQEGGFNPDDINPTPYNPLDEQFPLRNTPFPQGRREEGAPWEIKKGIRAVESSDGKLMKNPKTPATGFYGQFFNQIENLPFMKNVDRNTFAADTMLQNKVFDMRWRGEIPGVPGLKSNIKKLRKDYGELTSDFTDNELAALSNFTGRRRAREYFASIRDGEEFKMPGEDTGDNKSVEQYMKEYRTAVKKKRKGGYKQKYQLGGALQNVGAYTGYTNKGLQFQLEPSINILGDACRTGQCFAESDRSLRIGPTLSGSNLGITDDLAAKSAGKITGDIKLGGKLTYESIFSRGRGYWDHGHFGLEGRGGVKGVDKTPFYEGKAKFGILGRPDWGRYGYGAYGRAGTDTGVGVGAYGRLGALSGEAGYNFQTGQPEFKIGLGYNFRKGGMRRKCKYGCW